MNRVYKFYKTAGLLEDIVDYAKDNARQIALTGGGAALGAGLGGYLDGWRGAGLGALGGAGAGFGADQLYAYLTDKDKVSLLDYAKSHPYQTTALGLQGAGGLMAGGVLGNMKLQEIAKRKAAQKLINGKTVKAKSRGLKIPKKK